MIKFFRQIRQQLLTDNKFSKYLLYAIGEILLVIIGILIALQINNKNQENNNLGLEKEYLLFMQSELKIDSENLAELIENLTAVNQGLDTIIANLETDNKFPVDTIAKLYQPIFYVPNFRGHTETFESIEASGHLSLVRNININHDYFTLLKQYETFYKYFDDVFLSFAIDFTKEASRYFAFDTMRLTDAQYAYSQDSKNTIMMSKFTRSAIIGHAKGSHRTVKKLMDTIDTEITSRFKE